MKVIIFCGGRGMRLREYSENVPKPLVPIGDAPVMWHLMKYYSYFGHKDFILCLGYKSETIKRYFLDYTEALSSDFILSDAGKCIELLNRDFSDWQITFADTGINSLIGERLCAIKEHVKGEEVFLANYADGLSNVDMDMVVERFLNTNNVACFVSVPPTQTFHLVEANDDLLVTRIRHAETSNRWINGGYFVLRQEIFNYIQPGEDLVNEPFKRLIREGKLMTIKHKGFWACMDTFKERQQLEDLWSSGTAPWQIWMNHQQTVAQPVSSR